MTIHSLFTHSPVNGYFHISSLPPPRGGVALTSFLFLKLALSKSLNCHITLESEKKLVFFIIVLNESISLTKVEF